MAHKFRYGFKAEAERYAEEFRSDLGIQPHGALCPRALADHLGIPVFGIKNNERLPKEIKDHWAHHLKSPFSGLIIADGSYKEVHHNDYNHPRRQNSDLAHELAHIILGHDTDVPLKENGERAYHREVEEEAKWLGATLLLPKKATVFMVLNDFTRAKVEEIYEVSWQLYRYRVRVTDAERAARSLRGKLPA